MSGASTYSTEKEEDVPLLTPTRGSEGWMWIWSGPKLVDRHRDLSLGVSMRPPPLFVMKRSGSPMGLPLASKTAHTRTESMYRLGSGLTAVNVTNALWPGTEPLYTFPGSKRGEGPTGVEDVAVTLKSTDRWDLMCKDRRRGAVSVYEGVKARERRLSCKMGLTSA